MTASNSTGRSAWRSVLSFAVAALTAIGLTVTQAQAADLDPENTLLLELTTGQVVIALKPDLAPAHVARIKTLAREGFYDGITFHRVIEGFMAQAGDPTGTGGGGSSLPDLDEEFSRTRFERGTLGAARTNDPNSFNSQFFITFGPQDFLNDPFNRSSFYTVFGQVVEGMEAVDALSKGQPPRDPDRIVSMRVMADTQ